MKPDSDMSKYRKVLLVAQRTKQLQNGARPRVRLTGAKPSRIAMTEVEQGLISVKPKTVETKK